jgi:hypothetical protein
MQDMSSPVGEGVPNPYGLWRCKTTKPVRALILSETWVGVRSHYVSKQSVVCQGSGCEICESQRVNPRWRAYLMARLEMDGQPIVTMELTERCYAALRDRLEAYGSLRGHTLRVNRTKSNANAPLHMQWAEHIVPAQVLSQPIDLVDQVAKFYRVQPDVIRFGLPVIASDKSASELLGEARQALKLKKA